MRNNEFIIVEEDGVKKKYNAIACLYAPNSSQGFVIYSEDGNDDIKIGEIVEGDGDVYVEKVTDPSVKKQILDEFVKLCDKNK